MSPKPRLRGWYPLSWTHPDLINHHNVAAIWDNLHTKHQLDLFRRLVTISQYYMHNQWDTPPSRDPRWAEQVGTVRCLHAQSPLAVTVHMVCQSTTWTTITPVFLVDFSEREQYAVARPSVVCLSSVTFMRPIISRLKFSTVFQRHLVPWPSINIHGKLFIV